MSNRPRQCATLLVILSAVCAAGGATSEPASSQGQADRITVGQAAVLGVVEGLTEYLPVSSTGHLILASHAMGLTHYGDGRAAVGSPLTKGKAIDAFEIVIQLGAVLAVIGLYRKRVGQMLAGMVGRNPAGLKLVGLLAVAFLPAAIVGLALHTQIKEHLFGPVAVSLALAVGGVAMIACQHFFWTRRKDRPHTQVDTMVLRQAALIGLAQCLALWPGMSRSMVTMVAALIVGLDMVSAAEFSFLLALPTLGAATLYEAAKSHEQLLASAGVGGMLVGLVVSGVVAALAVKGLVRWLTRHGLVPFGIYRIGLAVVVYVYFLVAR